MAHPWAACAYPWLGEVRCGGKRLFLVNGFDLLGFRLLGDGLRFLGKASYALNHGYKLVELPLAITSCPNLFRVLAGDLDLHRHGDVGPVGVAFGLDDCPIPRDL